MNPTIDCMQTSTVDKTFITAQELLRDSFWLARQVVESGFKPNFIIGVWRGGAPVGIAIQEYLDFVGIETDHIAIRTSSYLGIDKQDKTVRVHGLDYIIDNINADDRVLLVDDVFDSGRSLVAVLEGLRKKTRRNMPDDVVPERSSRDGVRLTILSQCCLASRSPPSRTHPGPTTVEVRRRPSSWRGTSPRPTFGLST